VILFYRNLWPVRLYHIFFHVIKGTIFLSPQLLPETFLILRRIRRDTVINVQRSSCKVLVILVRFNRTLTVSAYFRKLLTSNCIKMRPVGTELFHTDGHTDMTKLTVDLRNFKNSSKIKSKEGRDTYVDRVRGRQLHGCSVLPASCRRLNVNLWSGNPKQELHRDYVFLEPPKYTNTSKILDYSDV
jgi:hypothetical protein